MGEIYVKYSPLGNNDLQKFLESEGCEVNFPGLMGFCQYCIFNMGEDYVLYGGNGGPQVWLRPPAGLAGRHRAGHAQGHIQRGLLRPRPL